MTDAVRFWFDYVSPYAYLASTQIRALAARHAREVDPTPVLFAGLLDATGARGPAEIAPKREYMFKDVMRLARVLGVPIEPPAAHPFNPLIALRATGCVADRAARWRLVDALYRAVWVEGRRIDDAATVARAAGDVGLDGAALIEQAATPDAKEQLRAATNAALAAGAFGVPTMLVARELFWGVDSLHLLDRFLGGENDAPAERVERWRSVVPSATRKRGEG